MNSRLCKVAGASAAALALAAVLGGCVAPPMRAVPVACGELPAALTTLGNVRITKAEAVAADDKGNPAHCMVQGRANERTGSDGRAYAIGFEMRLPGAWNKRFLHQVNGGNDGVVVPALGALATLATSGLQRGFAVISSDSGHNGDDAANAATGLAKANVFGLDPQARRDYGYSADGTLYPVAQALIERHYGERPLRNYMMGCSNGGRHALVAATRYADRYDGILAGAPGFNLPKAAVQHAWDVQSWQMADPDIRKAFSPADMNLVAAKVLEKCDTLDGVADGIVSDIKRCQPAFKLADLQCSGAKTATCLSANQVTALTRAFGGARNSKGEALYSDWSFDAGMGTGNWRFWKLESQIPPWDKMPLIATMGAGSLAYIFSTPPSKPAGSPAALLEYLTKFNFDTDAPRIFSSEGAYSESSMAFMTPPDVDNPRLADFAKRGGKLIVYHGNSDAVFSINDTMRWYDKLSANSGGNAAATARLFAVPGMAHCSGGPATDQFDSLGALVDWVEKGTAPEQIIATVKAGNPEVPPNWAQTRTRPLCTYPKVATYNGTGSIEEAASFSCR